MAGHTDRQWCETCANTSSANDPILFPSLADQSANSLVANVCVCKGGPSISWCCTCSLCSGWCVDTHLDLTRLWNHQIFQLKRAGPVPELPLHLWEQSLEAFVGREDVGTHSSLCGWIIDSVEKRNPVPGIAQRHYVHLKTDEAGRSGEENHIGQG